jgi:hypothetical protein
LPFRKSSNNILKAFRFSENSAGLFFLLLRHKFSSIAYVKLENFNAEKRKKKEQKIQKPRCFEYILKAFRFSENSAGLFFLLLRHKFSSIALVRVASFDERKRKKKPLKTRGSRCFEQIHICLKSIPYCKN